SASGKFLQASLLTEHHVAIVPREKIFPTFPEFFASLAEMPTNITLITGPSRTADIEKTLIIGMHGPKKVTVIVW
ncbi:MAG: LUD domain-containing protein, partial [Deltaproteobacteria bacterium]|nr:LUD domain-containing protein [Deltaproteobacteria bacterium]